MADPIRTARCGPRCSAPPHAMKEIMNTHSTLPFVALMATLTVGGCSKQPTARDICSKLETAGFGKACREVKPEKLSARAAERYDFDLVSVPGKGAAVMSFAKEDDYEATVKMYEAAALFAGPHRYGSPKALVFVQASNELSLEDGKKLKAFVEGL